MIMTLESLALLPELQKIPRDDAALELDFEGQMTQILGMDRDHFSIELSTAVEAPLMTLFEARNVDDVVPQAHELAFSNSDLSLHEHYQEMVSRGEESVTGFMSNLKGKVAELRAEDKLEEWFPGYDFELASNPTQPIWDIRGVGPEGTEDLLIQVKAGGISYVPEVLEGMEEAPTTLFAVSHEIYDRILETAPELGGQLADLGFTAYDLTDDVAKNLSVLASNLGIDVPDGLGEMLPIVGEVVLGIKLIIDLISTERDFKDVELQDRSRVHAMKALVLMSRFGVSAVCINLGGAAGTVALPGVGTAVGALGGGGLAFYLNRRLRPRMMDLAMHLAGVTKDDLFYFRNKVAVDRIGESLASTMAP